MKKLAYFFLSLLLISKIYSQPSQNKKILELCENSKIEGEACFVVLLNGDTIRGKTFTKKQSAFARKATWIIGGRSVSPDSVRSYQDEYSYVNMPFPYNERLKKDALGAEYVRMYVGKLSLFMAKTGTELYHKDPHYGSMYYLSRDPLQVIEVYPTTTEHLKEKISSCPLALDEFNKTFNKANNRIISDYNKILSILRKYDSCK